MLFSRRFLDPLYGPAVFSGRDGALVLTPELQRLRYVRMCNIHSLWITGASEPKRFEHSLGVWFLAKKFAERNGLSESDAGVLTAAALLHDTLTPPFGHSLQYILEDNSLGDFEHEDLQGGARRGFFQEVEASGAFAGKGFAARGILGVDWQAVGSTIAGKGPLGRILAGDMDIDNIDNVVRLAYHVGITDVSDLTLPVALAESLSVDGTSLCIPESALLLVSRWQKIRTDLYQRLLYDWGEFSAKAMLTHVMELATQARLLGPDSWIQTDEEFMLSLERNAVGPTQYVRDLVRRLRLGDLFHPALLVAAPDVGAYESLAKMATKRRIERVLTDRLRVRHGASTRAIFHPILDKRKTSRSVRLRVDGVGSEVRFGDDSAELLLGVFTARGNLPRAASLDLRRFLVDLLRDEFGVGASRDVPDPVVPAPPPKQTSLLGTRQ